MKRLSTFNENEKKHVLITLGALVFLKNDCVSLLRKEMSGVLVCSNKLQRNVLAGRQCSYGCGINYMVVIMDKEEKSMR